MSWYNTILPTLPEYAAPNADKDVDNWGCSQWIIYHRNIKNALGKEKANETILNDVDRATMWADVNLCKYDCNFMEYFYGQGIEGGNIFSKLYCNLEEVTDAAGGTVGTVAKNVNTVATVLLSPYILIPAGAYIAYSIYKDYEKRKK